MNKVIGYRDLLIKINEIKDQLVKHNYWINGARFDQNINLLKSIVEAYEQGKVKDFLKQQNKGSIYVFMFKEVREFVYVFQQILPIIETLDPLSQKILKDKLDQILKGPQFTLHENFNNSAARNYMYELLTAAYFISLGARVQFREFPDIIVSSKENVYMVECKRLVHGNNEQKRLDAQCLDACKQLLFAKRETGIKIGIISIDLSSCFEKGKLFLKATDEEIAYTRIQKDMEPANLRIYQNEKIKNYATRGLLVASILTSSIVTFINNKQLSWDIERAILVFMEENKNRSRKFVDDFNKENKFDFIG